MYYVWKDLEGNLEPSVASVFSDKIRIAYEGMNDAYVERLINLALSASKAVSAKRLADMNSAQ